MTQLTAAGDSRLFEQRCLLQRLGLLLLLLLLK